MNRHLSKGLLAMESYLLIKGILDQAVLLEKAKETEGNPCKVSITLTPVDFKPADMVEDEAAKEVTRLWSGILTVIEFAEGYDDTEGHTIADKLRKLIRLPVVEE